LLLPSALNDFAGQVPSNEASNFSCGAFVESKRRARVDPFLKGIAKSVAV
jgi:hypothetical protein